MVEDQIVLYEDKTFLIRFGLEEEKTGDYTIEDSLIVLTYDIESNPSTSLDTLVLKSKSIESLDGKLVFHCNKSE